MRRRGCQVGLRVPPSSDEVETFFAASIDEVEVSRLGGLVAIGTSIRDRPATLPPPPTSWGLGRMISTQSSSTSLLMG